MCVLAVALSPLAALGAMSACSSFSDDGATTPTDEAGTETGSAAETSIVSDAGTDQSADAAVGPFCGPAGGYAFCESFDDANDSPWGFDGVFIQPPGGTAGLERTKDFEPRSAPNALRSVLIVGGKSAVALKTFPTAKGVLHLEVDVRATAIPTKGYVGLVALSKNPDTGALGISVADGSLLLAVAEGDAGTFTYPPVPKKLTTGAWFHVVIDYDSKKGTVSATADGSTFPVTPAPTLGASDPITMYVGATAVDSDVAAELVFDNVTVSWK